MERRVAGEIVVACSSRPNRTYNVAARRELSFAALAFRCAHAAIALAMLGAIAYVWWCALTGRRGKWLRAAVTALLAEGTAVVANHGDCPLGPLQERLGDPVPLFELVLSARAARRAVPVLGAVTAAPLALLAARRIPTVVSRSPRGEAMGNADDGRSPRA